MAISRLRLSANSSASQVTAATNSTHTPMNVVQRNTISIHSSVLNAAATGETEYSRMLATMTVLRPSRSISQPPSRPNTPPHRAAIQSIRPVH